MQILIGHRLVEQQGLHHIIAFDLHPRLEGRQRRMIIPPGQFAQPQLVVDPGV